MTVAASRRQCAKRGLQSVAPTVHGRRDGTCVLGGRPSAWPCKGRAQLGSRPTRSQELDLVSANGPREGLCVDEASLDVEGLAPLTAALRCSSGKWGPRMDVFAWRRGGRLLLILSVLSAAAFAGLALEGSRSAADDSTGRASSERRTALDVLAGAEPVASMATETSKTYRRPDGTFVTRVFAQKADAAATVDPSAHGFEATAGDLKASFPETLAKPLRVTRRKEWVSLRLRGGGGRARAKDARDHLRGRAAWR